MCQSELAKEPTKTYETLWIRQPSPNSNWETEFRLEAWSEKPFKPEFVEQFGAFAYTERKTGAEILAQLRVNPPARIARVIKFEFASQ